MSTCQDHEFCHLHRHSEFSPLDGTGNAIQYAEHASTVLNHHWLGLTDHHTLGGVLDHIKACRVDGDPVKGSPGLVDMDSELRPGEKRHVDERITPIVGCELFWVGGMPKPSKDEPTPAYTMDDALRSRTDKSFSHNSKPHLCVHASGKEGWRNLLALITESNLSGFHGVPRCDMELLRKHIDGLVVTSACISSPPNRMILAGDIDGARKWHKLMRDLTKGQYWIELMGHDIDQQRICNLHNINIAQELGIGVIATSDAHYFDKTWSDTQEIVFALARRDTLKKREEAVKKARERAEDEGKAFIEGDEVYGKDLGTAYLMSAQEMRDLFAEFHPDIPASVVNEALCNTTEMAKSIKPYVLSKQLKMPNAKAVAAEHAEDLPSLDHFIEEAHGDTVEAVLRAWCAEGFQRILSQRGIFQFHKIQDEYRERLEFELDTIRDKGTLGYFVIVADAVRAAKENGVAVGPGRGSAAGCLLSYLIGITGVDPIPYKLLFERFMNPDREGLPDIDVDFSDRDWVIRYLKDKYGDECVASVITYQTFGPRATINDISRFYDAGPNKVDYLDQQAAKEDIGILDRDIVKLAKTNPKIAAFADKYPDVWKHMTRVDDMVRGPSKHASAVVIAGRPIHEFAPIQRVRGQKSDGSDDSFVIAWADRAKFPIISEYGMLKFDVLGLEELEKHTYALDLIEQRTGERPDIYNLPVFWDPDAGEPEVLEMFGQGLTVGVFQFIKAGMTNLLRAIKPDSVLDIVAANAMHRPGPMEFEYDYAKRKNGKQEVTFPHDAVIPFMAETYGLPAYQEQIMLICKALGNFTAGQADNMRKAVSKLYRLPGDEAERYMSKFKATWDAGCEANGIVKEISERIWANILSWGKYGFNKSHSACYGLLAYVDMWLKKHYPKEFYAALLTYPSKMDVSAVIREAASLGVTILPPDINKSERRFTVEGDAIRYGLLSVKNIGGATVTHVEAHRPYESFEDFLEKHKPKEDVIEEVAGIGDALNLLRAGAFDPIADRYYLLGLVDATTEDVYRAEWSCGAEKKGIKRDPTDPYDRVEGEIQYYKAGKKKGQPKTKKPVNCPKHKGEGDCEIVKVEPYRDKRTVAEHLHHNMKLRSPRPVPDVVTPPTQREISEMEQDSLGLSLTMGNIVADNRELIAEVVDTREVFEDAEDGSEIIVGGEITKITETVVKKKGPNKGKAMAFFDVSFGTDTFSCTLFHHIYPRYKELLEAGAVMVQGRKDTWNDKQSVIVKHMQSVEDFVAECQQEDESAG